MKKVDRIMGYKLGRYDTNGDLELLYIVNSNDKDKAKLAYEQLKEKYQCTIWVEKIEFIDPEEAFN